MMLRCPRPVVVSLNYHEVTRDPRVMKQARALAEAGFDMHVFCDWPEGAARDEAIDGVTVHRFRAFDPRNIRAGWAGRYGFMQRSLSMLRDRVEPITRALQLKDEAGPDLPDHLFRSHYIHKSGAERRKRKMQRIRALFARWLRTRLSAESRRGFSDFLALERHRRRLFQAEAILFAEGLIAQPLPVHVDVVHAHDIYTLPAGVLLAQRTGARLIYDAHEYEPARATKMDASALSLPEDIEDDCFPFVSALISVSKSIAALYAERFGGQIEMIFNAPETAGDVPLDASQDLCRSLELPEGAKTIVFTGGIQGPHRGVDRVVAALEHLPGCHLILLGPRSARSDKWVKEIARKHGVADRIILLPAVKAEMVPSSIAGCTLAICPFQDVSLNHRFAMPNKLFEAAFAGIPICVSDLPEMRRFVETLGNGVVMDQTDPVAIAAAIRKVIENRDKYLLTARSRDELHKNYGWPAQVAKLLALYDKLGYPAPRHAEHFVASSD